MDTDLWWQFFRAGAKFKRLNQYSWTLRLHEDAKMSGHNFEKSAMSDIQHPSWEAKRRESEYIEQKYNIDSKGAGFVGKMILLLNRLFSWQYLQSLFQSKRYAGMKLKNYHMVGK